MAGQTIAISVLADTKPFSKAMKGVGTGIGVAFAAGAVAVGAFLASSIKAAAESEKIAAQTDAVIKSTGGAAGRSAEQIGKLTTELSRLSGVDDEVIQGGENILLTFTQIKGDQFDAATKAAVNLSVALGKDMAGSATLVGKALNDPIKGVGALSKVGVQLTDEQKALVKQMSAVGDTAGAQAVILGVLEEQFGGSAEAFGNTFEGAISKVQTEFGNLQETLGSAFLPALTAVTAAAATFLAKIGDSEGFQKFVQGLSDTVTALFSGQAAMSGFSFEGILDAIVVGVTAAAEWLSGDGLATIFDTLTNARAGILGAALAAFPGIIDALVQIVPQVVIGITGLIQQVLSFLVSSGASILTAAVTMLSGLIKGVAEVLPGLISAVLAILPSLIGTIVSLIPQILDAAIVLFTALVDAIPEIIPPLIIGLIALLPKLISTVLGLIPKLLDTAVKLFTSLVTAIPKILPKLISAIIDLAPKLVTSVIGMLPKIIEAAVRLFTGLVTAIPKIIPKLIPELLKLAPRMISAIVGMIPKLIRAGVDLVGGLVRGLWQAAGSVGKALLDIAGGAIEGFKNFLGIHSPSRMFAGFGANIGQGLANGLAGSEKLVSGAMDGLSSTVSDFDVAPSGTALSAVVTSDARSAARAAEPSLMELSPASIDALARRIAMHSKDLVLSGQSVARAVYASNVNANAQGRM